MLNNVYVRKMKRYSVLCVKASVSFIIVCMKKVSIFLILSSLILSSCSYFIKEKVEKISIAIAPSAIPSEILSASDDFKEGLRAYLYDEGYDVSTIDVVVYDTHAQTREAISSSNVDIAYLPVLQYLKIIDSVDYLASVTNPQLNMGSDIETYNNASLNDKPMADLSFRQALIYTGPSAVGKSLSSKLQNNELITWIDLNVASWCHVVVSNLDGYVYPSLWLIDEYGRRMGELFDHTLEVRGYADVVASLADESCDIAVGPSLLRYDYAEDWVDSDVYNRSSSIFDEVKVIGVTDPIYSDVFVSRKLNEEEDSLSPEIITLIQNYLVQIVEEKPKLFEVLGFSGIEILSSEDYQTMIPALEYVERIMS